MQSSSKVSKPYRRRAERAQALTGGTRSVSITGAGRRKCGEGLPHWKNVSAMYAVLKAC